MNRGAGPKNKVGEELSFILQKENLKNFALCKSFIVYFFSLKI